MTKDDNIRSTVKNGESVSSEYFYFMDAARSVLMSLGIFLHAGILYGVGSTWLVHDPNGIPEFDVVVETIHVFRMPAFFIISGFFCALTAVRYDPMDFYIRRIIRIAIPLLFVGITLNSVQGYIVAESDSAAAPRLFDLTSASYWVDGKWVSHLWFLINLLVYFSVVFFCLKLPVWTYLRHFYRRYQPILEAILGFEILFLITFPAATIAPAVAAKIWPEMYQPLLLTLSPYRGLWYANFFLLGVVFFFRRDLLERFSKPSLWAIIVFIAAIFVRYIVNFPEGNLVKFVLAYADAIIVFVSCSAVFYLFSRFLSQRTRLFTYLADASYTIYLVHHILVVIMGIALLEASIPVVLKYGITIISVFGIAISFHHFVVLRFRTLGLLFNGKWRLK